MMGMTFDEAIVEVEIEAACDRIGLTADDRAWLLSDLRRGGFSLMARRVVMLAMERDRSHPGLTDQVIDGAASLRNSIQGSVTGDKLEQTQVEALKELREITAAIKLGQRTADRASRPRGLRTPRLKRDVTRSPPQPKG